MRSLMVPDFRLTVAIQIALDLASFHGDDTSETPIAISTCLQSATVRYSGMLHDLVLDALDGTGDAFNRWIHPQLLPSIDGYEYNQL